MKLKKIFAAFVFSAVLAAGLSAKNNHYGMDVALGIVGVDHYGIKKTNWRQNIRSTCNVIDILPIKVNTYICPWLNNHLGLYGSVGILPGIELNHRTEINGVTSKDNNIGLNFGFELMFGPAFGVDFGSSGVRFQIGAPLHALVGGGVIWNDASWDSSGNWRSKYDTNFFYGAFGAGLTPQFRFGADKRFSFVVGMDFVFDVGFVRREESTINGVTVKETITSGADNTFHFSWVPYLGLGINFGD